MPNGQGGLGANERKCAALDAHRALQAGRRRKRDEGILELRKHSIYVDFLPGEPDSETDREADMWRDPALRTLLSRGTHFKVVPAPCEVLVEAK